MPCSLRSFKLGCSCFCVSPEYQKHSLEIVVHRSDGSSSLVCTFVGVDKVYRVHSLSTWPNSRNTHIPLSRTWVVCSGSAWRLCGGLTCAEVAKECVANPPIHQGAAKDLLCPSQKGVSVFHQRLDLAGGQHSPGTKNV